MGGNVSTCTSEILFAQKCIVSPLASANAMCVDPDPTKCNATTQITVCDEGFYCACAVNSRARARGAPRLDSARARAFTPRISSAGPNITIGCDITYPQFCPPTVACATQRFAGQFCEPQGAFEPQLCLPGHYCPDARTMLPCPAGTYCMRGSTAPTTCSFMSYCPEKTESRRYYGGLVFSFLLDAVLVALFLLVKYRLEPARARARRSKWEIGVAARSEEGFDLSDVPSSGGRKAGGGGGGSGGGDDAYAPLVDALSTASSKSILEEGFRVCNAGIRLDIEFDGLTLVVKEPRFPDGKTILSQVTGRIRPGRVTAIMGPSGAGKSTFLNVLMGKLTRTSGSLSINGQPDEMHRYKRVRRAGRAARAAVCTRRQCSRFPLSSLPTHRWSALSPRTTS